MHDEIKHDKLSIQHVQADELTTSSPIHTQTKGRVLARMLHVCLALALDRWKALVTLLTLKATQGQILSQSSTDATSGRWHLNGS